MNRQIKYEVKISFRKLWDEQDGTVYKKVIRINKAIFHSWLHARMNDISNFNEETNSTIVTFLPSAINLQGKNGKYKMLNLTQSEHFVSWIKTRPEFSIDLKRASCDCNTCLLVEDEN